MGFESASIFHKVALPVSVVATLLQIVAVATVGWLKFTNALGSETTLGLWRLCGGLICVSLDRVHAYYNATRAMEIIGMILCIVATVKVVLHIALDQYKRHTWIGFIGSSFGAALFILIGVIVWGAESAKRYSTGHLFYSFGLAIVAAILMIITGILGVLGRRDVSG